MPRVERSSLAPPLTMLLTMLLAACVSACSAPLPSPSTASAAGEPGLCHYDVRLERPERGELAVQVRCDRPILSLAASSPLAAQGIVDPRGAADPLTLEGPRFSAPAPTAAFSYRVPLAELARRHGDIDLAYGEEGAWMTSVATWVLQPDLPPGSRVTIRVDAPEGTFATGLVPIGERLYSLRAEDVPVATYAVFGQFRTEHIVLPGPLSLSATERNPRAPGTGSIEVVRLPGRIDTSDEALYAWIRSGAHAVTDFFRGFPVGSVMLVLIPTPGHAGVAHGKVVAAGGATIALNVGMDATEAALQHDWILIHELFHLGFPSFRREGKWLDEGLATYFEPIIRARAGWRAPDAVWSEFARDMWRGVPAAEGEGLMNAKGSSGIYWGGAVVSLLADVRARRRSYGAIGLEDGVRAVLAEGGDATEVWTLDEAIRVIDGRLEAPILRQLANAHARAGSPVFFPQLMQALGVERTEYGIRLYDDALLASVRKAIIAPPRAP